MNRRRIHIVCILAVWLTACGAPGASNEGNDRSVAAPGTEPESTAIEHTGFGTVNSVDRASATVNVSHAAVASAGWPAMTMDFKLADPDTAAALSVSDRIEFRFTTEGGGTITAVEPLP